MSGRAHEAADGGVIGNVYDKYGTKNPVARFLMNGFLGAVSELYRQVRPKRVLEVGCGEGRLATHLIGQGPPPERFVATDVALEQRAPDADPRIVFEVASVYELPYENDAFDLVVCCEVLEHLERPREALPELARVAGQAVLLSTPREPIWRALNMARGKYLTDLGNTPGHINHWSRRGLTDLARSRLSDLQVRSPLPWTVILGKP